MISRALVCAIMDEDLAAVKRLLNKPDRVNQPDQDGFTPLMFAASVGNPEITGYILGRGAEVNARNSIGQTALMIAAQSGHKNVLEQLLKAGADIHAVDDNKRDALMWSVSHRDVPNVVSSLIAHGADPNLRNIRGLTPLMYAAMLGHDKAIAVLLMAGADEAVKYHGKTAYDLASAKGLTEICRTINKVLKHRHIKRRPR